MKYVVYLGALHDCVHHVPNFDDRPGAAAGEMRLAIGQNGQGKQALNEWHDRTGSSILFHDSMAHWLQHVRKIVFCALYFEFHSGCGRFICLACGSVSDSHSGLVTNFDVGRTRSPDKQCRNCIVRGIQHTFRQDLYWLEQV